jgi:SEC-C motif-containing protein
MRSRYAAYALKNANYIMDTTHPEGPLFKGDPQAWRKDIYAFCRSTEFAGLEILETTGNTVTFHAMLLQKGQDASFTERSEFRKHEGRWKYFSGEQI